jgi:3-dehydroquinate synthase
MLAAAKISNKMGLLDKNELISLKGIIRRAGLTTELPDLEVARIIQAIKHDKKMLRGKIRFILPRALGDVFITDEVSLSLVERVLVNWNGET